MLIDQLCFWPWHIDDRETVNGNNSMSPATRRADRRSFIVWIEHKPLAVDHLAVLCDRDVDAGAALSIDQFDSLRHRIGIFAAMIHGFEAQPCPIQMRVFPLFSTPAYDLLRIRTRNNCAEASCFRERWCGLRVMRIYGMAAPGAKRAYAQMARVL